MNSPLGQPVVSDLAKQFIEALRFQQRVEQYSAMLSTAMIDQYARKQSQSPELFDDAGQARWVQIGGEMGGDGHRHGGHPVKIDSQGKMLTGAFAGQTMGQAFGKGEAKQPEQHKNAPEKPDSSKPVNSNATERNGVTPDEIKSLVPGLSVDPSEIRGTHVLFEDEIIEPREINNRRIAARARRQQLEREKAGMFANEVAAEQKDPKEELEEADSRMKERITAADTGAREKWLSNLNRLAQKSPEDQAKLVAAWNAAATPKDHAYFGDWLSKAEQRGLASKVTDRSDIADKELRSNVERMDKTWRTLKDIEKSANPDSPHNIAPKRLAEELAKYKSLGISPPAYESDKPSWEEIQKTKSAETEAKRLEAEKLKSEQAKELLFSPDELKPAIGLPVEKPKSFEPTLLGKPGISLDTRANESAKTGDQMGLFGDVANVPSGKAKLDQVGTTKGQQMAMFDTKGDPDQMLMFDDGVTPEDRLMPEAKTPKPFEPVLLGSDSQKKSDEAKPAETGPIPFRERKEFAAKLANEGKLHSEIVDAMMARGVAASDARRLSANALGDKAQSQQQPPQSKSSDDNSLPEGWSESSPGGMATSKDFIVDKPIVGGKWFAVSNHASLDGFETRREAIDAITNHKPDTTTAPHAGVPESSVSTQITPEGPKPAPEPPAGQLDTPATPSEKATDLFGSGISKGESPRAAAAAAQKKLDEDYEFARSSDVRNAGEDLKGSARHKVNAWKNLEDAEKNGTAAAMVTRDQLLKNEPHNLFVHADKNPLTALAMHYALKAFPAKPGTGKRGDHEKDRRQYLEAYKSVKEKAEELAKTRDSADSVKAIAEMQTHVWGLIKQFRGQKSDDSISRATATDLYNQTANDLVSLHKALATNWRANKTGVAGRTMDFGLAAKERYGNLSVENIAEHAKDVMDGKSLNVTFDREKKQVNRFDPSEMYVKIATRTGGRDLSKVTGDANKATSHMVETMGLRGVQWGNSVTDEERKHHAAKSVEALTDLADTLGLHPKDIALDGKLGLAIGARGRGGAVAHYEPSTQVVNLTRKNGVGSLAHEWAHGFDHYLSGFKGGDFKDSPRMMSDRASLTHSITSPDGRVSEVDQDTADRHLNSQSKYKVEILKDSGIRKAFQNLASVQSKYRERLSSHLRMLVKEGLMTHEKAKDYWQSEREIFARTFERYIQHKLESNGKKNTYLAGIETKAHKAGGMWPNDDEVKAMAPAFDKLFEEYRKHKHGSADPVKYSRAEAVSAFTPLLIDRYFAKKKSVSADDLWLDEESVVDRYEWVESNHPRNPAGSAGGIGGQFRSTKLRELPDTDTVRGVDKSHDFHHSKLPPDLQKQALNWSAELHRLVGQPMNTNYDEQLAKDAGRPMTPEQVQQLKEQRWKSVDKNEVRKLLDQMNQMDKQAKTHGIDLASHINASRLIPPELAMRLSGGRRFFDPTKMKAKAAPSQSSQQQTQQQPESKRWQDDPAKMAEYERRKGLTPSQPKSVDPNRVVPGTVVQNKNRPNHIINENLASHINGEKKAIAATPEPEQSSFSPTHGLSSQAAGKVDRAAADTVGDGDQSKVDHFKGLIMDAWKLARDQAQEHNAALNTLQNLAGGSTFAARLSQHLARGGDVASVEGFDTVVDHARRHFPHLVGGADDAESGVVDMFRSGMKPVPQPWHDEVIDQAVQMAPQGFFDEYVPSAANASHDEPVPFSVVADCRHFVQCYWLRSFKDYYAGKSQMSFNWDETAHPRETAKHDGKQPGQFAPKSAGKLPDGFVAQPRAKAGGETSEVDGKFYKGGALMPVHGLFSGQEKPAQKKPKHEGTSPIVNANEDGKGVKAVRERSKEQIEADRERMEHQRKWDELKSGPIAELFGWIGDRPNSKDFRQSPGHKFWAPMAEKLGTSGVDELTKFMREKAIEREKNGLTEPMYSNVKEKMIGPDEQLANYIENIEWGIENYQHFHTKKHLKAVPNSRAGEVWLGEFIKDSSMDDKLALNNKLKELLTPKPTASATAKSVSDATKQGASRKRSNIGVFVKPIVGPSGSSLVAYDWKWTWEPSEERKVSDWSMSEKNERTGRDIVHHFQVRTPDGLKVMSVESAIKELGLVGEAVSKVRNLASAHIKLAQAKQKLQQLKESKASDYSIGWAQGDVDRLEKHAKILESEAAKRASGKNPVDEYRDLLRNTHEAAAKLNGKKNDSWGIVGETVKQLRKQGQYSDSQIESIRRDGLRIISALNKAGGLTMFGEKQSSGPHADEWTFRNWAKAKDETVKASSDIQMRNWFAKHGEKAKQAVEDAEAWLEKYGSTKDKYSTAFNPTLHPRDNGGRFSAVGDSFKTAAYGLKDPMHVKIDGIDNNLAKVSNGFMSASVPVDSLEQLKSDTTGDYP